MIRLNECLCLFVTCIIFVDVLGNSTVKWDSSCRQELYGHYLAKNCIPQGEGLCPDHFSCPQTQRDFSKCFFRGAAYEIGQRIPVNRPCSRDCSCRQPFKNRDIPSIECAIIDCPNVFRRPDPNCMPLFSHDRCCSTGEVCFRDGMPTESTPVTCHANNKMYMKGQYVVFEDFPCQSCICQEGFNGPFGPGCQTIDCGFDFRFNREFAAGCVPIYYNRRCCAIGTACPDDQGQPHATNQPVQQQNQNYCYFGGQRYDRGEKLSRQRCEELCACITPPELTCIEFKTCEEASNSRLFQVFQSSADQNISIGVNMNRN